MSEILPVARQLLALNEHAGFGLDVNLAPALAKGLREISHGRADQAVASLTG